MRLLDHVSITVADLTRAAPFWEAVMAALGADVGRRREGVLGFGTVNRSGDDGHSYLAIRPSAGGIAPDNRHWCFRAPSRAAVDAFHAAGLAAGGTDDGPPGLRPHYHADYYAAFLRDPDGNRVEAVCHAADQSSSPA